MQDFFAKIIASVIITLGVLVLGAIISVLLAWPVMWTWNYVIPSLFGLKLITWGQAWCLSFLAGVFFKSTVTKSSN